MRSRLALRGVALGYLTVLLALPVGMVFYRAFEHGIGALVDALTTHDALHALELTLLVVAIAVPLNTVFGVACALALERRPFRGRMLVDRVIDLPFVISPIVVGLALILVYGEQDWAPVAQRERTGRLIPGVVVTTIGDGGHFLSLDQPAELTDLIVRFAAP